MWPTKQTKLARVDEEQMDQRLDESSIVCLQEANGIVIALLDEVAERCGFMMSTRCHWEGVVTFYDPNAGLELGTRPCFQLGPRHVLRKAKHGGVSSYVALSVRPVLNRLVY